MPIEFGVGEAIELLKCGKFTLLSLSGTIPAAEAVDIVSTPMPRAVPPSVEAIYHIEPGFVVLTERFNWGETTRPDKVYYELWQYGGGRYFKTPYAEGFYCGSKIRGSNVDNVCTHIFAGERIHVRLWNCSSPAEDVYYDFTVWYFTYPGGLHGEVLEILLRETNLLSACLEELKGLRGDLREVVAGREVRADPRRRRR